MSTTDAALGALVIGILLWPSLQFIYWLITGIWRLTIQEWLRVFVWNMIMANSYELYRVPGERPGTYRPTYGTTLQWAERVRVKFEESDLRMTALGKELADERVRADGYLKEAERAFDTIQALKKRLDKLKRFEQAEEGR